MGCGSSRRYAVDTQPAAPGAAIKAPGAAFDDLPQNGAPVKHSSAGVLGSQQASASDAQASISKYHASKEVPTSFAKGTPLDDSDDEDLVEVMQPENTEVQKMKLAEQFWATPTSEALKMRAPASGHTLSSQRIVNRPMDDLAFGIAQDRRRDTQDKDLAGGATGFLRAMPRPHDQHHHHQPQKMAAVSACGHRGCVGLGFCISDDVSDKPPSQAAAAWALPEAPCIA